MAEPNKDAATEAMGQAIGGALALVLAVIVAAVVLVPALIIWGWVIATLWAWFIVPTFGLAPLSIATAIGIKMVVLAIKGTGISDKNKNDGYTSAERFKQAALGIYITPFALLAVGYVAHLSVGSP